MSKLYYDRSETYTSMFIQPFRILFTYNSSQRKTYYMHTAVNLSTEAVLYVMSNVPSRGDFPSILAVSNCNNVNALCVFNNNWIFQCMSLHRHKPSAFHILNLFPFQYSQLLTTVVKENKVNTKLGRPIMIFFTELGDINGFDSLFESNTFGALYN